MSLYTISADLIADLKRSIFMPEKETALEASDKLRDYWCSKTCREPLSYMTTPKSKTPTVFRFKSFPVLRSDIYSPTQNADELKRLVEACVTSAEKTQTGWLVTAKAPPHMTPATATVIAATYELAVTAAVAEMAAMSTTGQPLLTCP